MNYPVEILRWAFLIPVAAGSIYGFLRVWAYRRLKARARPLDPAFTPPVTLIKPVHGLEKGLRENLRSACLQDYPDYQVLFCADSPDDAAVPLVRELEREFPARVSVSVRQKLVGTNKKMNNVLGGIGLAKHPLWVMSDSDALLKPDYLRAIVAPFADPRVGCAYTLYRGRDAAAWYEKLGLLYLSTEFMPNVVFAYMTGASGSGLGPSMAMRRDALEKVGGFEAFASCLSEDYLMAQAIAASGEKTVLLPYCIETRMDLRSPARWWQHQAYCAQTIRIIQPAGYFASLLVQPVPFALAYLALGPAAAAGWAVLTAALLLRWASAAWFCAELEDREGLAALAWLPLRDLAAVFFWALSFVRKTAVWRGTSLTLDGPRILPAKSDG